MNRRRLADLSVVAPFIAFVLLMPPVIGLFAAERTVFGAPLILIYLAAVWLGAIAAAALLSRAISRAEPPDRNSR